MNKYNSKKTSLFYYQTAYNWLPIFKTIPILTGHEYPTSIRGLNFMDEKLANLFFTLACSRIAYWLWRVEGDGFHLTNNFLMSLPFQPNVFTKNNKKTLEELGTTFWESIQGSTLISNNSDKLTLNYCPHGYGNILDKIDTIILDAYDINPEFLNFLKEFLMDTIIVDRYDEPKYQTTMQLIIQGETIT